MAGEVISAKRPRYQSNQRFDVQDADAASRGPLDYSDAVSRAVMVTPRASSGATATGLILTGFGISVNPTTPTDGLARVTSALGVALDSNGRLIVKPDGTTADLTIPSGTNQIYAYFVEDPTDAAIRRFVSPTNPFSEVPNAMDTTLTGSVAYLVRAGNGSSVVAESPVLGTTRPLVFLGLATNTAGAVTFDGSGTLNRLSTVIPPSALPTSATVNGSMRTLHDMVTALAHAVARDRWLGARTLNMPGGVAAAQTNNFHAYNEPSGGLDQAVRGLQGTITIGDDAASVFGDFSRGDFASDNALLVAAIAALPASGGTIVIKQGVSLSSFTGTVAIPANAKITFVGASVKDPTNVTFDLGASGGFVCASGSTAARLAFVDCTLRTTSASSSGLFVSLHDNVDFVATRCVFTTTSSGETGSAQIAVNAASTTPGRVELSHCRMDVSNAYTGSTGKVWIDAGASSPLSYFTLDHVDCTYVRTVGSAGTSVCLSLLDVRDVFRVTHCSFTKQSSAGEVTLLSVASTDNTTSEALHRKISSSSFRCTTGGTIVGTAIALRNITDVAIDDVDVFECRSALTYTVDVGGVFNANLRVSNVRMRQVQEPSSSFGIDVQLGAADARGFYFHNLQIRGDGTTEPASGVRVQGTGILRDWRFENCKLFECPYDLQVSAMLRVVTDGVEFSSDIDDVSLPSYDSGTGSSSQTNCAFTNCKVVGYRVVSSGLESAHLGLFVRASNVFRLTVDNNVFSVQDTLTWGGSSTTFWRVIDVRANNGSIWSFNGNRFFGFSNITGAHDPSSAVRVSSQDDTTLAGAVAAVTVSNNVCSNDGGDFSSLQLLTCFNHSVRSWAIDDNVWETSREDGAANDVSFDCDGAGGQGISFSSNVWRVDNPGGLAGAGSVFRLADGDYQNVTVLGNQLSADSLPLPGISLMSVSSATVDYLVFSRNIGLVEDDLSLGSGKVRLSSTSGTITNTLPTLPGSSGSAISDNLNIDYFF